MIAIILSYSKCLSWQCISQETFRRKIHYYINVLSFKMHLMIINVKICPHRFYLNVNNVSFTIWVDVRKFWNSMITIIYRAFSICKCFKSSNITVTLELRFRDLRYYWFPKVFWRNWKIRPQITSWKEYQGTSC